MSKPDPHSSEASAELIDFLAGELEPSRRDVFTARLDRDPALQREAELHQGAWQLLDYLPCSEPSSQLTSRTLSHIHALAPVANRRPRLQIALAYLTIAVIWIGGVLLTGIAGYSYGKRLPHGSAPAPQTTAPVPDEANVAGSSSAATASPESSHPAKPSRLSECDPAVQSFVRLHLMSRLSDREKKRLAAAEGDWPAYPQTLVALADMHATSMPGAENAALYLKDLPADVRSQLNKLSLPVTLWVNEGRYPEFGIQVQMVCHRHSIKLDRPLGPVCRADFMPSIQTFIHTDLEPLLSEAEKQELKKAEGRWPAYPHCLADLGRRHRLLFPDFKLPGSWNDYRSAARK
jgi:hypothetical protein